MKKLLFLAGLIFACAHPAHADYNLFNSTNVATNVTGVRLNVGRATLLRVVVGKAGTTSTLDIWDGTNGTTFLRKIASIDTTTARNVDFDVAIASGIVITTAGGAAANLSIIYRAGQ